jgi:hypothetical protein
MRLVWRACLGGVFVIGAAVCAAAQTAQVSMTWPEVRDRFRATNPTLQAGLLAVDESKASETTAYLRPNPQWSLTLDQVGNTEAGTFLRVEPLHRVQLPPRATGAR